MPRLLLALLLLVPTLASAEVCTFDRTTVCVSATLCTPNLPAGCTLSADDFWDVGGTGASEITRLRFEGSPTGGTFTLGWNGETTAPIAFEDNALCTGLNTPFACCSRERYGWCNLAHNIKSALEALDGIEPGDVAMAVDCNTQSCDWTWIGRQVCTDVAQPTCSAALTGGASPDCTVSTPEIGEPPQTPATVYLWGSIAQNASPGAGIRVRCGSTLNARVIGGRTITLGPRGLQLDYGSNSILIGGIRGRGAASPSSHLAPWTPADGLWRVSALMNCPDGTCDTNVRRLASLVGGDPAPSVAPGDVVYFPLGGNSMDEGFWYDVTAASADAEVAAIDIDPAQSQTSSVGWTLARKGITRATTSAASAAGARTVRLADGAIPTDDVYVGFCLYVASYPYVIKRSVASTGEVTLLREEGLRDPVESGETVYLSTSCHRAGDDFYVASPIRLRSATTGTRPAEQEDGIVRVRGNTNWDWVVIDWARLVTFEAVTGTLDHVWLKDRAQNYSSARFDDMYGRDLGSFQVTGGPDLDGATQYANCDAGDDSDCGQHGIGFSGSVGNTVAGWFERHGGDDCIWSWDQIGRPSDNRIDVFRCQHRLGNVSSMECMSSYADDGISIGVGECINVTGRGAGGSPGPGAGEVLTIGPGGARPAEIGSLFALYGSMIGSNTSIRLQNLWATRMDLDDDPQWTSTPSVFFNSCTKPGRCAADQSARNVLFSEVTNFLIDDWTSNVSAALNANGGCIRARNGIIKDGRWTERASDPYHDRLLQLSECKDGAVWADNVGWIDPVVTDLSPSGYLSLVSPGIREAGNAAAPGSYARNLLFYWSTPSPTYEPDVGIWDGGGTVPADSLVAGGLGFVGFNGNSSATITLTPESMTNVFAGQLPVCFAGTPPLGNVDPVLARLLPEGSLEGPPPAFPQHSFVSPANSAWGLAGCGLVGSPGVCTRQRWHQWEDVSVQQTCYGALLDPPADAQAGSSAPR